MTAKSYGYSTVSGAEKQLMGESLKLIILGGLLKFAKARMARVVTKIARRVFLKKTQRANTLSEIKIACPPLNIILFVHWSLRSNLMKDNQGACDEPRGVQEARHSASTGIN